jgi:hypothetical protein
MRNHGETIVGNNLRISLEVEDMARYSNEDTERYSKQVTLIPSFLRQKWDVVSLGRLIGSFVLGSAVVLAFWQAIGFSGGELQMSFFLFWNTLIGIGSWGVFIILLAELVDRVTVYGDKDDSEEDEGNKVGSHN